MIMRALFAIALGMGALFPTAANAGETWWLMAGGRGGGGGGLTWSVPTNSLAECEMAGEKFKDGTWHHVLWQDGKGRDYVCVKGK